MRWGAALIGLSGCWAAKVGGGYESDVLPGDRPEYGIIEGDLRIDGDNVSVGYTVRVRGGPAGGDAAFGWSACVDTETLVVVEACGRLAWLDLGYRTPSAFVGIGSPLVETAVWVPVHRSKQGRMFDEWYFVVPSARIGLDTRVPVRFTDPYVGFVLSVGMRLIGRKGRTPPATAVTD